MPPHFLLAIPLFLACATIHRGPYGTPVDERGHPLTDGRSIDGLKVSGEEIPDLSSPTFGAIEVTFENTTAAWIHLNQIELHFGDPATSSGVLIPSGADLEAWRQATLQRMAIDDSRLASVDGPVLFALGGGVAGGRRLAAVGAVTGAERSDPVAEGSAGFPAYHLLATPLVVPPGLFTKRWVVLNTTPGRACISHMVIEYTTEEGHHGRLELTVRGWSRSDWQQDDCGR
jgi:hypothetical protein